jgi:hypothetical protein
MEPCPLESRVALMVVHFVMSGYCRHQKFVTLCTYMYLWRTWMSSILHTGEYLCMYTCMYLLRIYVCPVQHVCIYSYLKLLMYTCIFLFMCSFIYLLRTMYLCRGVLRVWMNEWPCVWWNMNLGWHLHCCGCDKSREHGKLLFGLTKWWKTLEHII